MNLTSLLEINSGGVGSGCRGDGCGRPKVGRTPDAGKQERGKQYYVPHTKEEERKAYANQDELAKELGKDAVVISDHKPFDIVWKGKALIELKTKMKGKQNAITVHPKALVRKNKASKKMGLPGYTVVIDERAGSRTFYWRDRVGSFKLSSMNQAKDFADLKSQMLRSLK